MFEFWHQNQRLATLEFGKKIQRYVQYHRRNMNMSLQIKKKLPNKVHRKDLKR